MNTARLRIISVLALAAGAALAGGCGKSTRHDSSPAAVQSGRTAEAPAAERPTERAGTDTGNTGHGKGSDASSRPITGMSGSPTGMSDRTTDADGAKK